ncbi:MAG: DNA-binding protein [Bacteroidetes bacterium]|nr:MAG: DNA-binding protein [Bacteroidota bacterium]
MGRSQESFNKKEVQKKKEKKRLEKEKKKLARKGEEKSSLDDMIAYVDENGMLVSEPPDPKKRTSPDVEEIEVSVPKQEDTRAEDAIKKGTVAFFNDSKGFGFINEASSGNRIFVHISALEEEVMEGDKVQFEVEKGPRGLNAVRVKRIG